MPVQSPTISNFFGDSGTLGDGRTDSNVLTLWGTAVANSTVSIYDGSTLLGSATANSSGAWAFETPKLADSAHTFTATATVSAETSPPSAGMSVTVVPSVTHFVGGTDNWSDPTIIDGQQWYNHNPGKPWSVTNPDSHTIRTEIRPNELWLDGGGERSEISGPEIADGSVLNISYTMTVEPGTLNPGLSWLSLMQWHEGDTRPFVLLLDGEKMEFVVNLGSSQQQTVYHASSNIQRGQAYDIQYEVKFGTNGYLDVWLDGVQIVDYNGALGTSSNAQYLKLGVYRGYEGQANYTMAVDYSNIIWSTNPAYPTPPFGGSSAPPSGPVAPTIASYTTDSGIVGDGVTNDNTLTLNGSATANSTVKVYDGTALLGSVTANGSGAWSYTTAALSNGSHSLTATATNGSGTSPFSAARVVTVDTAAPGAPGINTFSNDTGTVGDGITSDNTLTLTGTAAASTTVGVYDGTTLLGTVTANGTGAWSYTTAALANGAHSFTATATDAAGNTSAASTALSLMIDSATPPPPNTNLVVNGGFERGSTSGWTEGGNVADGSSIYIAPTEYAGEVHTGNYSVGLGGFSRSDGILSQNIATTAGQHYTLSFWLRVDNSYGANQLAPDNHFVAKWNGQTLMAQTNAADSGYRLYTFDVVGVAGNSRLEFSGYNLPDAMRLDDISVTVANGAPPVMPPIVGNDSSNSLIGTSGDDTMLGLGGKDTLTGAAGTDVLDGGPGDDTLIGGAGTDSLQGGAGIDRANYATSNAAVNVSLATGQGTGGDAQGDTLAKIENLTGSAFSDYLTGSSGANSLVGLSGSDILSGSGGADTLIGGAGNDTLTGGSGSDFFQFDSTLNATTNVDTIADFNVAADTIRLDNAIFTALGETTGTLAADMFFKGAAAHDSSDRIVYNDLTGALIYDSNGSSPGGATQFATLSKGPEVTYADFVVI